MPTDLLINRRNQSPRPRGTPASGLPTRAPDDYRPTEDLNSSPIENTTTAVQAFLALDTLLFPTLFSPIGPFTSDFYDYNDSLLHFSTDIDVYDPHEFTLFSKQFTPDFEGLNRELRHALAIEPLLDGYTHAGERPLIAVFKKAPSAAAAWAEHQIAQPTDDAAFAAELLRLLSRFRPHTATWRAEIVRLALGSHDLLLRDAALQAIESWHDPGLLQQLEAHREPVPWLAKYARQVLLDLRS